MAVILSIYFLGLTFMPCEDTVISSLEETEFQAERIADHSGAHADDCSPFCQCHCCHVHITGFENVPPEILVLEISTKTPDKKYELGDEIPHSFFQPPRV